MSIFKRWFGSKEPELSLEQKNYTINNLHQVFSGSASSAMKINEVFTCVKIISETVGALPARMYRNGVEIKQGREHNIFTRQPNDYQTMQQFIEMAAACYTLYGSFYAYPVYNDRGVVSQIVPFRNQAGLTPAMDTNGDVYMIYTKNDGTIGDSYRYDELFAITGFSLDGITPIRPLTYQADLLSVAKSQNDNQKEIQANGIRAQMALATENVFQNAEAMQRLRDGWHEFKGSNGAGKIPILENGIKIVPLNLTAQELNLLEMQEFTTDKIASLFRVPAHKLRPSAGTPDSVLNLDEVFLRDTIMPLKRKIDSQLTKLLRGNVTVELDEYSFFKASPWRSADSVDKLLRAGVLSVNEARDKLGLPAIEGGEMFCTQSNNTSFGTWNNYQQPKQENNVNETFRPDNTN